jgi:hypothetical protein
MIRFDYRVGRVGAEPFVGRELIKNSTPTGKLQFPGQKVLGLVVFSFTSVLQKTKKAGSHVVAPTVGLTT